MTPAGPDDEVYFFIHNFRPLHFLWEGEASHEELHPKVGVFENL